jgi:hypothetical protein
MSVMFSFVFSSSINRHTHLRDTLPYLERSIHVALETGDLEWAGYNSVRARVTVVL